MRRAAVCTLAALAACTPRATPTRPTPAAATTADAPPAVDAPCRWRDADSVCIPATEVRLHAATAATGPRVRIVGYRSFDEAVAALDAAWATRLARTPTERATARALVAQFEGRERESLAAFLAIARDTTLADTLARRRALIAAVAALQFGGDWPGILALVRDPRTASLGGRGADRAEVTHWAERLASLRAPRVRLSHRRLDLALVGAPRDAPAVRLQLGATTATAWLDTGTSTTLLADDVARAAGIVPLSDDTLQLATTAGRLSARLAVVDSLVIVADAPQGGRLVVHDLPIGIVARADLRLPASDPLGGDVTVAGVIGVDLLARLRLVIDLPARRLQLAASEGRIAGEPALLAWSGYPVLHLDTPGGTRLLFGLDTGADETFVTTSLFEKLAATPTRSTRRTMNGFGGAMRTSATVLRALDGRVGPLAISVRHAWVDEPRAAGIAQLDGVLGRDFLRAGAFVVDLRAGELRALGPLPP
jgi:hypothetical protein